MHLDTAQQIQQIKQQISLLVTKKQLQDAYQLVHDLKAVIPYDPELYSILSAIYYESGDLSSAENSSKIGLILDPGHFDLLYNLSVILLELGKTEQACFLISKAIDCSKDTVLANELNQFLENAERQRQVDGDSVGFNEETDFLFLLLNEIYANLSNYLRYNVDIEYMDLVKAPVRDVQIVDTRSERVSIISQFEGLGQLYELLDNQDSKQLLLKVLAYRALGNLQVKLPLNNNDFWKQRKQIKYWLASDRKVVTAHHKWELQHYSLAPAQIPIQLYFSPIGIHSTFVLKQYEYHSGNIKITARKDDVVIDCGGCWGDTALFFANQVMENGKVFVMEFIPSNLELMKLNLSLNPDLQKRITVVDRPVWNESESTVYFVDRGPASIVGMDRLPDSEGQVKTIAIDDLVSLYELDRVDFIKMDIEGAELNALHGAEQVIRRYRPTLAVSLYHSLSDFSTIPAYLNKVCLNYRYYLSHCTIFSHETVLFAVPVEKLTDLGEETNG